MIKFRHFLFVGILSILVYACGSDGASGDDNFDHAAQALKDNDSLVKFLKAHYYDNDVDSVKPMSAGKTALFNDVKLKTQEVKENDINYKLYVYVDSVGTSNKGFATVVDSVFVNYYGQRIVNTDSISKPFDQGVNTWLTLSSSIRGWTYGFTNFKGGFNTTNNGPITFKNAGKGVLFIPSGLAYRNQVRGDIQTNESLLFYIDLWDIVENTDTDNDGVPSIREDVDGDGDPRNDDTDGDNRSNFLDTDDDGDGILTKDEDANGDGDPSNDFSDPNNPTLPDYLNPNIK